MKLVDMVMPPMGESIMECTVLTWLKKTGDTVEADDSILEVATDKVDTEVPSPFSGKLVEILAQEGDVIEIGNVVARLEVADSEEVPAAKVPSSAPAEDLPEEEPEEAKIIEKQIEARGLPTPTSQEPETPRQPAARSTMMSTMASSPRSCKA
jgi:2-oxoglutarate dehydrogenase E2 component (dihydrolipoamide succinyltransferase)